MVATIRRIDTAFTTVRSFVTHISPAAPPKSAGKYDMMNVSQVGNVMNSLLASSKLAQSQARDTMEQYQARQAATTHNGTQQRLQALQHSSVSQNISALLHMSTAASSQTRAQKMQVHIRDGNREVGVKELARVGIFGGDKARRYELSL